MYFYFVQRHSPSSPFHGAISRRVGVIALRSRLMSLPVRIAQAGLTRSLDRIVAEFGSRKSSKVVGITL